MALNTMASINLGDTVLLPSPELGVPGVASGKAALSVSPAALEDHYCLPAPLRECDSLAPESPAPLPVDIAVMDEAALDTPAAPIGVPVATATLDALDTSNVAVNVPAWLVKVEAGSQPSVPSDNDVLFAPGAAPSASSSSPLAARPILSSRNLMTIAHNAYGRGQAGQLVPALLSGFDTDLGYSEIHDSLHLLWLMRKDVATLVRAIIIVGQARCKPPGEVLRELLEMAQQYTTYTD